MSATEKSLIQKAECTRVLVDFVAMQNVSFRTIDSDEFKAVSLPYMHISSTTVRRRLLMVIDILKHELSNRLPYRFGIMLDGWTSHWQHFCGLFAVGYGVPNER